MNSKRGGEIIPRTIIFTPSQISKPGENERISMAPRHHMSMKKNPAWSEWKQGRLVLLKVDGWGRQTKGGFLVKKNDGWCILSLLSSTLLPFRMYFWVVCMETLSHAVTDFLLLSLQSCSPADPTLSPPLSLSFSLSYHYTSLRFRFQGLCRLKLLTSGFVQYQKENKNALTTSIS